MGHEQSEVLSEDDPRVNTEEQIRKDIEDRKELQGPTPREEQPYVSTDGLPWGPVDNLLMSKAISGGDPTLDVEHTVSERSALWPYG